MVLQQCLACNSVMTEPCKSCVCGHVFENAKQIGGKRFSEYRAKLYSRLEKKRIRQLARESRKPKVVHPKHVPAKTKLNVEEVERNSCVPFKSKVHSIEKPLHRRRKGKRFRPITDPSPSKAVVPPQLVSRLPNALQEINRRLTGQNVMWWILQLQ